MKYIERVFALVVCFIFSMFLILVSRLNRQSIREFREGSRNPKCGRFPKDSDIKRLNDLWQFVEISKGTYKITEAYTDRDSVKVVITGPELDLIKDAMFCQVWSGDDPETFASVVRASDFEEIKGNVKNDEASFQYAVECPLDRRSLYHSKFVSLTANVCEEANNRMEIKRNRPPDQ
jgi:hypothetical protein